MSLVKFNTLRVWRVCRVPRTSAKPCIHTVNTTPRTCMDRHVVTKATSALPAGIKPLSHQVAGHFFNEGEKVIGFLECDDGTILKAVQNPPRGPRELHFYQQVNDPESSDPVLLKLRDFMPKYLGTCQLPEYPTVTYFRLKDVTKAFRYPCILDTKMGPITYDPLASQDKIEKEMSKYPPAQKMGFQLIGGRMYRPASRKYEKLEKSYLRTLDEEQILWKGLGEFFNYTHGQQHKRVIKAMLTKLHVIRQWFEEQRQLNFYASSLLLVYDACDIDASLEGVASSDTLVNGTDSAVCTHQRTSDEPHVAVNMIDFAHVFPSKECDSNYLKGVNGLIRYLERLLSDK